MFFAVFAPPPYFRSASIAAPLASPIHLRFIPLVVVVPLVAALGCGAGNPAPTGPDIAFDACQPLTLIPDPGIPGAEVDGVAAAIAMWNAAAPTKLMLASSVDAMDAATPVTVPVHFQDAAAPFHGFYDAPSGQIFINTDLTDHQLAVTVAHEVGHAFGLLHRTDQPSLMNPSNLMIEPQPVDINTLETRWGPCQ